MLEELGSHGREFVTTIANEDVVTVVMKRPTAEAADLQLRMMFLNLVVLTVAISTLVRPAVAQYVRLEAEDGKVITPANEPEPGKRIARQRPDNSLGIRQTSLNLRTHARI
ncbi:MAG TPA: hypothetical protein VE621_13315 [Bryobacteraceae bacterium]|jgi:hypothetical protein|nr:hypothetical protein [Bryobacteraceae bacterium]